MEKTTVFIITVLALVARISATCLVCPQAIPNDPNPQLCASNNFGTSTMTFSQLANWNCNHKSNKYRIIAQSPCPAPVVVRVCPVNNCGFAGPSVCGQLAGNGIVTVAEFANRCQLDLYNCNNPGTFFTVVTPLLGCRSLGL